MESKPKANVIGDKRPMCQHCEKRIVTRPRGLCRICFKDPLTRTAYPCYRESAIPNLGNTAFLPTPDYPTAAEPGTEDKIRVFQERVESGKALWHPKDKRLLPDWVLRSIKFCRYTGSHDWLKDSF